MLNTQELKRKISISSLFISDGHNLRRLGSNFTCLCPFHKEKSPSCVVYPDHYFCFGCHANGDIFDYIMQRDNCSFKDAFAILSGGNRYEIQKPFSREPVKKDEPEFTDEFQVKMEGWRNETLASDLKKLGHSLKVNPDSLVRLDVAWAKEHNAWAIPMRHSTKAIVGIRLRNDEGRKWAVKGSKNGLFIPHGKSQELVITEGPTDCAAALSMGLFAIGLPMAGFGHDEINRFIAINGIRRVIIIPDNDEKAGKTNTGMMMAEKLISSIKVPKCEMVLPTKDFREFAALGGGRQLFDSMLVSQRWI